MDDSIKTMITRCRNDNMPTRQGRHMQVSESLHLLHERLYGQNCKRTSLMRGIFVAEVCRYDPSIDN